MEHARHVKVSQFEPSIPMMGKFALRLLLRTLKLVCKVTFKSVRLILAGFLYLLAFFVGML